MKTTTLSRSGRKERASRLLEAVIPHLGLSVKQIARGPFTLRKPWPRGLRRTPRSLWNWISKEPDHPLPAGRGLLLLEEFLREAEVVLRRRKVIRKSLEELIKEKNP